MGLSSYFPSPDSLSSFIAQYLSANFIVHSVSFYLFSVIYDDSYLDSYLQTVNTLSNNVPITNNANTANSINNASASRIDIIIEDISDNNFNVVNVRMSYNGRIIDNREIQVINWDGSNY